MQQYTPLAVTLCFIKYGMTLRAKNFCTKINNKLNTIGHQYLCKVLVNMYSYFIYIIDTIDNCEININIFTFVL